jgi:hypothetical protein
MLQDAIGHKSLQDNLVRPEGFEPPTYGSEDHCSIQLSYGRVTAPPILSPGMGRGPL